MREEDFIELDFGEDEPEEDGGFHTGKENPEEKQGRFFISYPRKKTGETPSVEKVQADGMTKDTIEPSQTDSMAEKTLEEPQAGSGVKKITEDPQADSMAEKAVEQAQADSIMQEHIEANGSAAEKIMEEKPVESVPEEMPEEEPAESVAEAMPEEEPVETVPEAMSEEEPVESVPEAMPEEEPAESVSEGVPEDESVYSTQEEVSQELPAERVSEEMSEEPPADSVPEEMIEENPAYSMSEDPMEEESSYSMIENIIEEVPEDLVIVDVQEDTEESISGETSDEAETDSVEDVFQSDESLLAEESVDFEDAFLEDVKELSDPEQMEEFYNPVKEIPVPGAEALPDFNSGNVYGAASEVSSGDEALSAIPKEREKIAWYLTLPFITGVLLIPVAGIIAAGILLYVRYKKYGHESQVKDLTTVYILLVICLMLGFLAVYCLAQYFQNQGDDVKETVSGQAEREAAESLAREEAEQREQEELEAWLRTSAQADIGLEEIELTISESYMETGEGTDTSDTTLEAEVSGENTETEGVEESAGFWEAFIDKLTGSTGEEDQEYLDLVAADMQELAISGDSCAQYSLMRLASQVTLFTASYDDRFFGERQVLFSFMSSYHGTQMDSQTFHLKSSLADMFTGTVHWDATLDNTMYRYLGTISDGMPQGMGVVLVASAVNSNTYIPLYAGTFVNGTLEGYGMEFKENNGVYGVVYEGYFSGGKYAGRGTAYEIPSAVSFQNRLSAQDLAGNQYTFDEITNILNSYTSRYTSAMNAYQSDGISYAYLDVPIVTPVITDRGRYQKGKLNGYGIYYGNFGIREYAGILKNNVRSGLGTSYYDNGCIEYDGEWKNNNFHGEGILYNADGSVWYQGEFANGDIKPVTQ